MPFLLYFLGTVTVPLSQTGDKMQAFQDIIEISGISPFRERGIKGDLSIKIYLQ
jgi:hypothetical protein